MLEPDVITPMKPSSWERGGGVNWCFKGYQNLLYKEMSVGGAALSVMAEGHLKSKDRKSFATFAKHNC